MVPNRTLIFFFKANAGQIAWEREELEDMKRQLLLATIWQPFQTAKVAIDTLFVITPPAQMPKRLFRLPFLCIDRKTKSRYVNATSTIMEKGIPMLVTSIDETPKKADDTEEIWEMIYLFLKETTIPLPYDFRDAVDAALRRYLREHEPGTPSKRSDALCIACLHTPVMEAFQKERGERNL